VLRIDATQQLAFVEAEAEAVIGLTRTGLPLGPLTSEDGGQPIEISEYGAIDWFFDREESRLVREQLSNGDPLFAVLSELGPVRRDAFLVIEPPARMRHGQRHRGESLGR
jgi:hypothetical protein